MAPAATGGRGRLAGESCKRNSSDGFDRRLHRKDVAATGNVSRGSGW
jgi:hypothetical protein